MAFKNDDDLDDLIKQLNTDNPPEYLVMSSELRELSLLSLITRVSNEILDTPNIINNLLSSKYIQKNYSLSEVDMGKLTHYTIKENKPNLFETIYTHPFTSHLALKVLNDEQISKYLTKNIFEKVENENQFEIFTFMIMELNYKLSESDERFIYVNKYNKVIGIINNKELFDSLEKNVVKNEVTKDKFKL